MVLAAGLSWLRLANSESSESEPMALVVPADDGQGEVQPPQQTQSIADESLFLLPPWCEFFPCVESRPLYAAASVWADMPMTLSHDAGLSCWLQGKIASAQSDSGDATPSNTINNVHKTFINIRLDFL